MPLMIALAVREMHMTPDEALLAATAGGAAALHRNDIGRLCPGAAADFAVLDAPTHVHLAYRPGGRVVAGVWRQGVSVTG
jgi:imidazolonepropionase